METFRLIGQVESTETIAEGGSIRDLARLTREYGRGQWRKCKGRGVVELRSGTVRHVELHWYEAHGIGRRELKIKRYLE